MSRLTILALLVATILLGILIRPTLSPWRRGQAGEWEVVKSKCFAAYDEARAGNRTKAMQLLYEAKAYAESSDHPDWADAVEVQIKRAQSSTAPSGRDTALPR